jgi:hypothetical protein
MNKQKRKQLQLLQLSKATSLVMGLQMELLAFTKNYRDSGEWKYVPDNMKYILLVTQSFSD